MKLPLLKKYNKIMISVCLQKLKKKTFTSVNAKSEEMGERKRKKKRKK